MTVRPMAAGLSIKVTPAAASWAGVITTWIVVEPGGALRPVT